MVIISKVNFIGLVMTQPIPLRVICYDSLKNENT
jgi:hypothetical protein